MQWNLEVEYSSIIDQFYSHFKNDQSEHKTRQFLRHPKNNDSYYIANSCPMLNIM